MSNQLHTHRLTGCSPIPLAGYLKALGILRIVAEQLDPQAEGWWEGDCFHLRSAHDSRDLQEFFLSQFKASPIIAPWNGGSGFYPKDNKTAIQKIAEGKAERLSIYRATIAACHSALKVAGIESKADGEDKQKLLIACRGLLPDEAVKWLDAAFVLTADGAKYPPLLGTGGNDGRLDFTNNYMQRLVDVIDPLSGKPTEASATWLSEALFQQLDSSLQRSSILGQFDPGAMDRPVNPWDYVLMLEGALVFAAASVRRLDQLEPGTLSYPFSVRTAGVGYGSSASADESSSRAEIWLPVWTRGCRFDELQAVFSEGRAQLNDRPARNGVDFARAIAGLGVDRGIDEFVRYGFQARNGLAYFAVPLGRFRVTPQPQVNLLAEPSLDRWLESFRRAASGERAPSSARRALRRIEKAILELCQRKGAARLQEVLIGLGEAESVLAVSTKWREEAFQRPVPFLSPQWLTECDDGTEEFRLAVSLAGMQSSHVGELRQHLEPVETSGRWPAWKANEESNSNLVWGNGSLENNLIAVLHRRAIEAVRQGERTSANVLAFPGESAFHASLGDVARFLGEETDDRRIAELTRGLLLLDWRQIKQDGTAEFLTRGASEPLPDATYGLLKLCHSPYPIREVHVRLEPAIARLAAAGRLADAIQLAARRLLASSLPPAFRVAALQGAAARRIAATLLFPVSWSDIGRIADYVLKPQMETA